MKSIIDQIALEETMNGLIEELRDTPYGDPSREVLIKEISELEKTMASVSNRDNTIDRFEYEKKDKAEGRKVTRESFASQEKVAETNANASIRCKNKEITKTIIGTAAGIGMGILGCLAKDRGVAEKASPLMQKANTLVSKFM